MLDGVKIIELWLRGSYFSNQQQQDWHFKIAFIEKVN
jgi:hypothetical protein